MARRVILLGCLVASGPLGAQPALRHVTTAAELREALASPGECTVRLDPGVYTLEEPLLIQGRSHVNLLGSGWNTTIQRTGAGPAVIFEDAHFCWVADLMVAGDGAMTDGIVYRGQSSSNTVRFCRLSNATGSGIRYEGEQDAPMSSNSVLYCHFIDNRGEQLCSLYNNDFYIIGNQFGRWQHEPRVGAALIHSSAGSYSLNYHWDNDVALTLGPGADYNRIENNRFEESRTSGIVIGNPETPDQWNRFNTFIGNTIHTNSKGNFRAFDAVVAYDAHDTIFCNNQVFSWYPPTTQHRSALVLGRGCSTWLVTGNILRHNAAAAIVAEESAGHLIKDNLLDTRPWGEP
jgi:hypothetical protein